MAWIPLVSRRQTTSRAAGCYGTGAECSLCNKKRTKLSLNKRLEDLSYNEHDGYEEEVLTRLADSRGDLCRRYGYDLHAV